MDYLKKTFEWISNHIGFQRLSMLFSSGNTSKLFNFKRYFLYGAMVVGVFKLVSLFGGFLGFMYRHMLKGRKDFNKVYN